MNSFNDETRLEIFEQAHYVCECRGPGCLMRTGLQAHHGIPNTKMNRQKYGNKVIQSARNGYALCGNCHQEYYWLYGGLKDERNKV